MTIYKKKPRGDKVQLYSRIDGKEVWIGPLDNPLKWDKSLLKKLVPSNDSQIEDFLTRYVEEAKLLSLQYDDPVTQQNYLNDRFDQLFDIISSLSPSASKQYKSKGKAKAEDETRLRLQKIISNLVDIFQDLYSIHKNKSSFNELVTDSALAIFPYVSHVTNPTRNELLKELSRVLDIEIDNLRNIIAEPKPNIMLDALTYKIPTKKRLDELIKKFRDLK